MPMLVHLASRSPQRLRLLTEAGYDVRVIAIDVAEPPVDSFADVESYVLATAMMKAAVASKQVPQGVLVAADTMTVVNGDVMGKPSDRDDAEGMLRRLSGSVHRVLSGLAVCRMPQRVFVGAVESTRLQMAVLSEEQLREYLDGGDWREKAGAYGIQEVEDAFIVGRDGSLSNVIGLPLERLASLLREPPMLSGG